MKKLLIAFIATLSSVLSASADNIVVQNVTLKQGGTATIDIELVNPDKEYAAFQLDLMLPVGVTAATDDEGDYIIVAGSRLSSDYSLAPSPIKGGIRVVCVSTELNAAISGTRGSLFTIEVKASATIEAKDYPATVTGVVFTTTTDRDIEMDDADFTISIESNVKPGDVNNDGKVTPADAIMILYYYFGVNQDNFNEAAADVNHDTFITPADAIEALYIYFGASGGNGNARTTRPEQENLRDPE